MLEKKPCSKECNRSYIRYEVPCQQKQSFPSVLSRFVLSPIEFSRRRVRFPLLRTRSKAAPVLQVALLGWLRIRISLFPVLQVAAKLSLLAGMTYCLRQDGLPLRVAGLRTGGCRPEYRRYCARFFNRLGDKSATEALRYRSSRPVQFLKTLYRSQGTAPFHRAPYRSVSQGTV